ncbi:MAG: hypothetical protein N4A37_10695 [Prolixibacteraceae bacterium]|nr:hypothetical protein [Prolixibacteraceae bacterium]
MVVRKHLKDKTVIYRESPSYIKRNPVVVTQTKQCHHYRVFYNNHPFKDGISSKDFSFNPKQT